MSHPTSPPIVPPLYDVNALCAVKKLNDPEREYIFAEITLPNTVLRYCMSSPQSRWRVQTLFTKEPSTIDWLHSFISGQTYVDIGANIGMYAVYAGAVMGAKVYAFEPESQNYAELMRSIFLNAAHGNIRAYCAAMGDKDVEVSHLLLNTMVTGGSFHDFGEPSRAYQPLARFSQGCVAFSLDHLVSIGAVPLPDHIKIDVDGHEHKVVQGMRHVLESHHVQTLLLECDPQLPHTYEIVNHLFKQGWHYNPDQARLSSAGIKSVDAIRAEIETATYAGNIIFAKNPDLLRYASHALNRFSAADMERMQVSA